MKNESIVVQDSMPSEVRFVDKRFFQLGCWLAVAGVFTTLAFCVLPRHVSPWYGPAIHEVTTAGMLTAVDLEQRGKVRLSKEIVFRAAFEEAGTHKPIKNLGVGLFSSHRVFKNSRSRTVVPHSPRHTIESMTKCIRALPSHSGTGRQIRQIITLEKTTDPLVYGVMPVFKIPNVTPDELEFCHEISAYTRCREKQEISVAPYKYEMGLLLDHRGKFLTSWPFVSNTKHYSNQPLSSDPEYQSWLVKMDRDRYPGIVVTADRIAAESEGSSRLALAQKMNSFFQQQGRFQYTLDFTEVTMDKRIDPIEDFFSNHRKGHCELYAAALTLMLRSQGIPARLVVGFHGSEYNSVTKSYFVRGTDAHAWVEVYLRPKDCTPQMNFDGAAGPGGAWKMLDPTPVGVDAEEVVGRGSAIELARSYWQDYVLGMEGSEDDYSSSSVPDSLVKFIETFDMVQIDKNLNQFKKTANDPRIRVLVLMGIAGLVLIRVFGKSLWQALRNRVGLRNHNRGLVALFADAISTIAPKLGAWVRNVAGSPPSTQFYRQLTQLLSDHGLRRKELQTPRVFAKEVAEQVSNHRYGKSIGQMVFALTDHYNAIRFGNQLLDDGTLAEINGQLDAVQVALDEAPLALAGDHALAES